MQAIERNFISKQSSLCHWQSTSIQFWNALANGSQISISCINKNPIDSWDREFAWEFEQGDFSQRLVKTVLNCQQFLVQFSDGPDCRCTSLYFSTYACYPPSPDANPWHLSSPTRWLHRFWCKHQSGRHCSVLVGYVNTWPLLICCRRQVCWMCFL